MADDVTGKNDIVTNDNFTLYAMHNYVNTNCENFEEFQEDLQRFKYLKRLFNKYHENKDLRERLILNHLIVLYNVFDVHALTKMLFLRLEGYEQYLKPFLILLSFMPEEIHGVDGKTIYSSNILMDDFIVSKLRKI